MLRRNLAVQFHPELTSSMLAGWLGNGGSGQGYGVRTRHRTPCSPPPAPTEAEARVRAHRLVDGFLDHVANRSAVAAS